MRKEEVDLNRDNFSLSKSRLIRILIGAGIMMPLPLIAYYLNQPFFIWFSLAFIIGIVSWQVMAYGFWKEEDIDLSVTNYYSKSYLLLVAILWFLLIGGISTILYLKLP